MDQREAFTRSLKAYPINPAAQEAFVAAAMAEARFGAATAVSLMRSDDAELAVKAESFVRSIDELAIQPLLALPVPPDPSQAASYIGLLVEPELELRRKVLVKLDSMLEDRRDVPLEVPLGPKPEEQAKPRRVCDEAYVAMRSMIQFGEDLVDQFSDRDRFLGEPEAVRDAAIRRARQSATWQRALGR